MSESQSNPAVTTEEQDSGREATGPAAPTFDMTAINSLNDSIRNLIELANRPAQQQEQAPAPKAPVSAEVDPDLATLEGMDRMQYANYLINRIGREFNQQFVGPINGRLTEMDRRTLTNVLAGEIESLKQKNPDFIEWKDEMIALSKVQPNLSPGQLYVLVKANNGEKVRKLAEKYRPEEPKEGEPGFRPTVIKVGFGGMTPSMPSGRGARPRNMPPGEAALSAWDQTVKDLGVEPVFDE